MNEMNNEGFALGWDDEFTNEQQEFVLLPEGEYPFEVTQMERARYEGTLKALHGKQVIARRQQHKFPLFVGNLAVPVQGSIRHVVHIFSHG